MKDLNLNLNQNSHMQPNLSSKATTSCQEWATQRKNAIGLILCLLLFSTGFILNGNVGLYFNISGLLVVLGGTLGAAVISYKLERLSIVLKVLRTSVRTPVKQPEEIIEILVDLSVKSKLKGVLSLQKDEKETTLLFLRQALGYIVDGYPAEQVRDLLNTEMYFFRMRREETERVLRTMSEICPAFGLVGSVVGLISMLAGVGDTSVILATVPIALTSTLYGVVLANFMFLPLASLIRERTNQELLLQKMILEAVVAIGSKLHPRMLERKLKAFLTPASRHKRLVSFKRIQDKFNIKAAATDS
jgi:chemotaxis protein MotA